MAIACREEVSGHGISQTWPVPGAHVLHTSRGVWRGARIIQIPQKAVTLDLRLLRSQRRLLSGSFALARARRTDQHHNGHHRDLGGGASIEDRWRIAAVAGAGDDGCIGVWDPSLPQLPAADGVLFARNLRRASARAGRARASRGRLVQHLAWQRRGSGDVLRVETWLFWGPR